MTWESKARTMRRAACCRGGCWVSVCPRPGRGQQQRQKAPAAGAGAPVLQAPVAEQTAVQAGTAISAGAAVPAGAAGQSAGAAVQAGAAGAVSAGAADRNRLRRTAAPRVTAAARQQKVIRRRAAGRVIRVAHTAIRVTTAGSGPAYSNARRRRRGTWKTGSISTGMFRCRTRSGCCGAIRASGGCRRPISKG